MLLAQLLTNGLQTGALYALVAAGFSLIFGMTRVFHAAHGATFTIAGFAFYQCYAVFHLDPVVSTLVCAVCAGAFGVALDRWVYAVIQRHEGSFFTVFAASFGAAIVVQNVISMVFGRGMVTVSTPLSKSLELLPGLFVAPIGGVIVACAIACFAILQVLLTRTSLGIALRALGENLLAQRKATPSFEFVGATVSFAEDGTVKAPIQINEIVGDGSTKIIAAGK